MRLLVNGSCKAVTTSKSKRILTMRTCDKGCKALTVLGAVGMLLALNVCDAAEGSSDRSFNARVHPGTSGAPSTSVGIGIEVWLPLPATDQFFNALVSWMEADTVPSSLTLSSADGSVTMPVCPYPQKATYSGAGAITAAAGYSCK